MNEIEQQIMDARKWIEFGKMFNNIACEGWEVILESSVHHTGDLVYTVTLFPADGGIFDNDLKCSTPYEAMKIMYFKYFLEKDDCEEVNFDFPPEIEAELYAQADKEGITIDELVVNILTALMPPEEKVEEVKQSAEIGLAKCCYNCFHRQSEMETICKFHGCTTEREFTCKDFFPAE